MLKRNEKEELEKYRNIINKLEGVLRKIAEDEEEFAEEFEHAKFRFDKNDKFFELQLNYKFISEKSLLDLLERMVKEC